MFKLLIHVANAMPAILDYKTREKAETAYLNIQDMLDGKIDASTVKQKDEFGVILSMPVEKINYVIFVDIMKQQELPRDTNAKPHAN